MVGKPEYDQYWRLKNYEDFRKHEIVERLKKAGFTDLKFYSLAKHQLVGFLQKLDRGLICYDTCTEEELCQFSLDRNINVRPRGADLRLALTSGKDHDKREFIETLEYADDHLTFSRFLDLPPELRNRIYEFYMADFELELAMPTAPPLVRSSKLMQREVLPLFYKRHTFEMRFSRQWYKPVFRFRLDDDTALWMQGISSEQAENITSLKLVFKEVGRGGKSNTSTVCTCYVKLSPSGKHNVVEVQGFMNWMQSAKKRRDIQASIKGRIEEVLKDLDSREERVRFTVDSMYALRAAVEAGYADVLGR